MRLFIAIKAPKKVRQHLTQLQKLFTSTAKITLTKEQHLTLKFLGEVSSSKAKQIEQKLKTIKFQPFTLKLSGIGFFPDENNARILWVGLQLNNDINEIQQKIEKTLETYFEKEQNFVPHLTLGRIKLITNKTQFHKLTQEIIVKPMIVTVNEFQLIESKPTQKGQEYKTVKRYPAQDL